MNEPRTVEGPASGRFEFRGKLGEGAMGVIYRALDRERGIEVAVKSLRRMDAAAVYRFKREFRTLCGLSHPNLVKLHELFRWQDNWFFTMELVDGVDFMTYVRGAGHANFDEARARDCLRQLAVGLMSLHAAGKLHRDIKPSNVLVDRDGRVVLCDFGLAVEAEPRPLHQTVDASSGTPSYMSPEQSRGRALGPASDWYSVGVMLHQLLYNALPLPVMPAETPAGVPEDLLALSRQLRSREPGQRPTGARVLELLGGDDADVAPSSHRAAPFVGRQAELDALQSAFARVVAGQPQVVCMHGRSGIGKTALTRRFLDELHDSGRALVLEGRCYEQESLPYKALDTVIDALSRYLRTLDDDDAEALMPTHVVAMAQLFPVLRRVDAVSLPRTPVPTSADPNEARRRGTAGLRQLFIALAKRSPVVIAVDDVQWGDRDSADLLLELLRGPGAPRVLVLTTYRTADAESSAFLREFLAAHDAAIELALAPLGSDASELLAQELLSDSAQTSASTAVARESEGNPFLLAELARYVNASLRADTPMATTGVTLEQVVTRRIEELPDNARAILTTIALAGRPVAHALVKSASSHVEGVEQAFLLLRDRHFVRSRGVRAQDDVEYYHDRIRETVVAMLPAEAARACHLRWAHALEQHDDPRREALAGHYHKAGMHDRAAHFAIRAAKQASDAFAFDHAVALYRWALELRPVDGRNAMQLRERLGTALARAGRGPEAAAEFLLAAEEAPVDYAMSLRVCAAEQMLRTGHLDEGSRLFDDILHQLGMRIPATPRRALFSVLGLRARIRLRGLSFEPTDPERIDPDLRRKIEACWAVSSGLGMVDTMRGMEFQARHLLLSLQAGDVLHISRAFAIEAMYLSVAGPRMAARTERLLDRARQMCDDDPGCIGLVHGGRALRAFQMGRFGEALDSVELALDTFHASCVATTWEVDSSDLFGLWSLYYLGSWRELVDRADSLRQHARSRGDLFGETGLCIGLPAASWLITDQVEQGTAVSSDVMSRWSRSGFHLQHYWDWVGRAQADIYSGDGVRALRRAAAIWPSLRRGFFLRMQAVRIEGNDIRARAHLVAATQHPSAAKRHVAAARRLGRRLCNEPIDWGTLCGTLVLAAVAVARADNQRAQSLFDRAAHLADDLGMAMHAAVARWRRGELIAGDEGRQLVAAAKSAFAEQRVAAPAAMAALLSPPMTSK